MALKTTADRDNLDPERWRRLKDILADALEQPSAAARAALVESRCAKDATLLAEAESLIQEAERLLNDPTDSLEECAEHATALLWQNESPHTGWRIGAYVVTRELGRGGMGAVYLAERADGQFEKQVAIKVLKRGTDTDEVLRRFAAERHILARLDHPNIARLLDAGTTDDGLPYFVMEYVAGAPVTRFSHDHQLSLTEKLHVFLKICTAVEVAHRNHVIHRDLKPSNILVTEEGEPKLLDFGIAKLLTPGENSVDLTAASEQRLTPTCASPEQTDGRAVTEGTDVYALGALLYEMLSGHKPHRFATSHPSREEIARVICEEEPAAPSSRADAAIARELRGDLDAISLFALRKQPECRYATVSSLADDIRRYLAHEPVAARQHTTSYRFKCLVARYRLRSRAGIAAAILLLIALAAGALWLRARQQSVATAPAPVGGEGVPIVTPKSIAVLPFDSFGENGSSSYFADGVQDNILTDLGKIGDLKVISRSGVAAFRGKARDMKEIGRQLGVANVLEGTVQTSGDRVRINAQLIDTRTNTQVWAEHYDRKVEDIFSLQSELAQTIAAQLNATLSTGEKAAIWKRPTDDIQAYDLYLRARAKMNAPDGSDTSRTWAEVVALSEAAIKRDPKFALAFALLNEAHVYIYKFGDDHSPERLAAVKAAAETALRLEPSLEEAHLALARYYYFGLADYRQTKAELSKIASSGAHGVEYYTLAGLVERRLGLWNETIRDSEKAVDLDPQDPHLPLNLIQTLNALKRYSEAERVADATIQRLAPKALSRIRLVKSETELARGNTDAALAALEAMPSIDGMEAQSARIWVYYLRRDYQRAKELSDVAGPELKSSSMYAYTLGVIAHANGDPAEAQRAFSDAREKAAASLQKRPNSADLLMEIASADAGLGRKEDAIREAEQAVAMVPVSADAIIGPALVLNLAQVYTWTGEHDRALDVLHQLVKVPFGVTYGDLKLSPMWDDLRETPRFNEIIEEAATIALEQDPTFTRR